MLSTSGTRLRNPFERNYYDDDDFIIVHLEHKILSMTSKKFNEIWRSLKGFLVYKKRPLPCARPTNAGV